MAYCGPRGIPLDSFLSWPESSQDAALSWLAYEARRCGSCGVHLDEWREDRGGSRNAYHPESFICPGCEAIERHRELPDVANAGRGVHIRLAQGGATECPDCSRYSARR